MEVTLESGELARAIGRIKGVAPSRQTISIINNLLLSTGNGSVAITATNMDVQSQTSVVCEVITPGAITIPAHVAFGIAKALPKTKLVTIKIENDRARVTCGKSKYDLRTLPAHDFPLVNASVEGAVRFDMSAAVLRSSIDAVKGLFDANHPQPFYKGLWMIAEGDALAFVAADGKRLARVRVEGGAPSGMSAIQIGQDAVREIASLLAGSDGIVSLEATKERLSIDAGGVGFTTRLMAGALAPYGKLFEASAGGPTATVNAGALVDALDRLMVVYGSSDTKSPCVTLAGRSGEIEISAGSRGADYGRELVDAEFSEAFDFSTSAPLFAEAAKLWPSTATLAISARPGMGALITSLDAPHQSQIIMPMTPPSAFRGADQDQSEAA